MEPVPLEIWDVISWVLHLNFLILDIRQKSHAVQVLFITGFLKKVYFPNSTEYSVEEEVRKIVRKLPTGVILQSQVRDVFPDINWKDKAVVTEYNERRWNESWTD